MLCLTEGFKEAAEKFRMESGIEPSVDLDSLDERIKIREMILKGQIQEAIALINGLHPELLDTNRYLYFHLQVHLGFFFAAVTFCCGIVLYSPTACCFAAAASDRANSVEGDGSCP